MAELDLKRFCGDDPCRDYLAQPFSVGKFTYATDGRIMLRVPRRQDAPKIKKEGKWDAPLEGIEVATFSPLLANLPPAPPPITECENCEGSGREHGCPCCECECSQCDGSGKLHSEQKITATVRGVPFALRYLRLMLSIPCVEVADKATDGKPLLFRFEGGIGAVMPTRGPAAKHIDIAA